MILRSVMALLIAAVFATPFWAFAHPAHACTCATGNLAELVQRADLVVVGSVQTISRQTTVEAESYLKGSGPSALIISQHVFVSRGNCETGVYRNADSRDYLLFLNEDSIGEYRTSGCAGTRMIGSEAGVPFGDDAQVRIKMISDIVGQPPRIPDYDLAAHSETRVWPAIGGALAALALGGALFAWRWRGARGSRDVS